MQRLFILARVAGDKSKAWAGAKRNPRDRWDSKEEPAKWATAIYQK